MRTLSLCSGIGGFELGAKLVNQRLGKEVFQLKALCEKNQFCRDRALKPNFPGVPIYEDIRDIPAISGTYDLIVGGLPCQPFSLAGKQKGESDDRNLFPEFFRLLCGIRPAGAIIENVPGLLTANSGQFFRDILWQFTEAGYSVAWDVVSCAEVGGVHRRKRIWIIAYSNSKGLEARQCQPSEQATIGEPERSRGCDNRQNETQPGICSLNDGLSDRLVRSHLMTPEELPDRLPYATDSDDIPYRKDMLQSLGNAIVPDVAAIALYKFLEITNLLEDEESITARNRG